MLIHPGVLWQYYPATTELPKDWKELSFDDTSWLTGKGGIGYADGDDSTIVDPVISLFLRVEFNLADTGNISAVYFYMDYDDAFVAYINGNEIARANISGTVPAYDTEANTAREATMYQGGLPEEYQVPSTAFSTLLKEGQNVLAIQVHNHNITSSDLSALPFLIVGVKDTTQTYQSAPDWFVSPLDFYTSHLPIIVINTLGGPIVDEPRRLAEMGIVNNGDGQINHKSDSFNAFHGLINIEIKGESAQMFPKKSYLFETQDSLGQNLNVALLDMPEENDWILYAPYSDKTLIKNVLSLKLSRDMGRYASRTQFCELFINESYQGLYVLMEKIKQDKNRVDIARLRPEDTAGDQLTGGYILRVDKVDNNDYPPFTAYPSVYIPGENPVEIQYFDPKGEDLNAVQRDYIREYVRQFEQALNSGSYLSYFTGYHSYIDKDALIDYIIVNEISKNIDAYIFSTYMYKDRTSNGGKLTMGPVWDFNIAYGNVDYNAAAETTRGWMYDEGYRMYWFRRMMNDPALQNKMSCRWHQLRSGVFSDEVIFNYIDSLVTSLEEPIRDNFKRWPVLGRYVWPNVFTGQTHEEEIRFLKNWLYDRLHWMDNNINDSCVDHIDDNMHTEVGISLFPNPFSDKIMIESIDPGKSIVQAQVYDISGSLIWYYSPKRPFNKRVVWDGNGFQNTTQPGGMYLLQVTLDNGHTYSKKIIRK